ncbi:hypothetical protein P7K49_001121 [Saguinus oedipus]|uniref:Ubiquitin-like domain-containing protein n=1 Tax=Saguinus oedipus TaxID=9490 RepID=A0ABQ9WDK4_SAGOE|nr:hypothetical protein P7K49_001121 [Saguinus oedipus]
MWIQVRTIDGSKTCTIEDVSRKATIEELRERVWALFDVRPECQRLFYRGKQPGIGAAALLWTGRSEGSVRRARGAHLAALRMGSPREAQGTGPMGPCQPQLQWGRLERRSLAALVARVPRFPRSAGPGRATGSGGHAIARETGRAFASLPWLFRVSDLALKKRSV